METYENQNPEKKQGDLLQDAQEEQIAQEAAVEPQIMEVLPACEIAEEPQQEQTAELPVEDEIPVADVVAQQPQRTKKISPYEDSPYVICHPVEVPVKQKRPQKERKTGGLWKRALCAVLVIALVAGACVATGITVDRSWQARMEEMEASFAARLEEVEQKVKYNNSGISVSGSAVSTAEGSLTPAQVYAMNVDAVVLIYNEITQKVNGQVSVGTATGSGFILNEEGYVVTNYHVVEGNGSLSVVLTNGKEYPAKLVGCDETNDVALLKIEGENLQAVTLGSSSDLIVGDQVVAIGNPLGELTSTLTVGYVSAKERDVNTDGFAINMLQTDAAINSGNSGGPLFNMKGEVIGITTAKYSGTSSSGATIEGVGFAIPIDDVSGLLSDLATYGYITGAYLGVSVSDMDPDAANYYGMPVGAYVQKVETGYAAERAGVQPKDIITALGGISVENVNDLTRALRSFKSGDKTIITLYRGGRELNLSVVLDAKPVATQSDTLPSDETTTPEGNFYDYLAPFFGGKD